MHSHTKHDFHMEQKPGSKSGTNNLLRLHIFPDKAGHYCRGASLCKCHHIGLSSGRLSSSDGPTLINSFCFLSFTLDLYIVKADQRLFFRWDSSTMQPKLLMHWRNWTLTRTTGKAREEPVLASSNLYWQTKNPSTSLFCS